MMKAKLTKVESTHNNLRTNEIVGRPLFIPEVGRSFIMWSEPLDKDMDIRQITTSVVKSVELIGDNLYEFKTMNSIYKLEILDND